MSTGHFNRLHLQECTVLGSNGFPFSVGGKINLAFDEGNVHCLGASRSASFDYVELAELHISGPGTVTNGGGFIGGGFGVEGALQGIAIAGLLNLLTTRSKIHTFLTLITNFGELHLHYGEMEPGALRMALAAVYVKLRRLDPLWIDSRLKVLSAQREAGALTDEQVSAAKHRLLVASEWKDPVAEAKDLELLRNSSEQAALLDGPKGTCPNCSNLIAMHADSCPRCKAAFGIGSAWQVIPASS